MRTTARAKSNLRSPPSRGLPARTSRSGNARGSTSCSSLRSPFATVLRVGNMSKQLPRANVAVSSEDIAGTNLAHFADLKLYSGGEPGQDRPERRANDETGHPARAGRDRRGGPRAARSSRRADTRDGASLRRHAGGRRGRLPARDRDPADEGAQHARGRAHPVAQDGGEARGLRAAAPARATLAGDRRRRAARPPRPRRRDSRAGRAPRAAATGRRGARSPEAARDPGARAEGGGVLVSRDLRDDGLVVHEGEPPPHGGTPGVPAARVGNPARRRLRPLRAAAVRAGRRRGERRGPRDAPPSHADLPQLPGGAARVPGRAGPAWRACCRLAALVAADGGGPLRSLLESALGGGSAQGRRRWATV